ncbi:hypothetical protein DFH09DRAFT_1193310 [Mycena vulgaris]|nr:hypothetical protein DFH09DRAFT_1193310 [Mycena vulgaris]
MDRAPFTAPMLAGSQANWALISALTLQVYKFYVFFPKERAWIKTLVYLLFVLQLAQTAIMSHFAYTMLVFRWGDPTAFFSFPWSSLVSPISGGLTAAIVQIFFSRRILILKGDKLWARAVAASIVLLALTQWFAGIINTAKWSPTKEVSKLGNLIPGAKIWLIGSAVCDITITLTMSFILHEYRSQTPWKTTDTLINKLIYNIVETGAVTSIVATVEVILFIMFPSSALHQLPAYILGPLYATVLVISLNARASMNPGSVIDTHYSGEINWRLPGRTTDQEAQLTVHITTHVGTESRRTCSMQTESKMNGSKA